MNLKFLFPLLLISFIFFGFTSFDNNIIRKETTIDKVRPCFNQRTIKVYYSNSLTNNQIAEIKERYIRKYNISVSLWGIQYHTLSRYSSIIYRTETWYYCEQYANIQPGNGGIDGEIDEEPYMGRLNNAFAN